MGTITRPKKSLGQHWLADRNALRRIAGAANFTQDETVVEVGPGTGALTRLLAARASRLIAVEVDPRLAAQLREVYTDRPHVSIVEKDATEASVEEILAEGGGRLPYVVVGNLPYYAGTVIVRHFLYANMRPHWLLVMLQEEVAERIVAPPGRMSYLSIEAQMMAEARILFRLPPRAFRPPPNVRSAVLRLDVRDSPDVEVDSISRFLEFVRAGFAAPRKRLRNSLAVGLRTTAANAEAILSEAQIDGTRRPATLTLEDWRNAYFANRRAG